MVELSVQGYIYDTAKEILTFPCLVRTKGGVKQTCTLLKHVLHSKRLLSVISIMIWYRLITMFVIRLGVSDS